MLADRLQKDTVLQYRRHQSFKLFALRLNRLGQRLLNCEKHTPGGGAGALLVLWGWARVVYKRDMFILN
jgi:hypothetical protein